MFLWQAVIVTLDSGRVLRCVRVGIKCGSGGRLGIGIGVGSGVGCRRTSSARGTVIDGSGHTLASHDRGNLAFDIAEPHFSGFGQRTERVRTKKSLIAAERAVVISKTVMHFGLFKECGLGWPRTLAAGQERRR